ncbi:phenylacetic acid degradation protein [Carbonactinospora thermoautotrophica]|uniref:Phenylacetic acid degradation protein n=1 Tax=Carbonactinospora thermoautotrophica TaxID=1469144 RepID=A0A132NAM7_9ACTN|nr:1,2-phenylacetyl-CoA epoxidase subunit PaaE [Carbonactinospora thermoautotrophica]KWX05034.1 phenylacetic acid degradation protein [Carbonactinospora thermoautotrophica]KWX07215.1 phenylacetic acid degradation protein [Carbonactinospora thermoautotrophica]
MSVSAQAPSRRRHAVFHRLRVRAVDRLTDDAVAVTFDVPDELREEYRFEPGQHLTIRWTTPDGEEARRTYSICAPATSGELRIGVKRLAGGLFSTHACGRLRPGDTLEVMTPAGQFRVPLDPGHAKHYAAIAAGSGITPILSIISTALQVEPRSRVTLIYGNRTSNSVMFLEELQDLKNRYPDRFHLINVLSREPQEVELFCGRIDRDKLAVFLRTLVPADGVDEWLLCGPYGLIEQARQTLRDHGVAPERIHQELFHVGEPVRETVDLGPAAPAGPASTVTVILDGRASTFELPAGGESVLEGALRVRNDAPYACKGGVCGTCRARLVEGAVRMDRNFALEQDELAAGFVLACQSHPTSERVVLDFDH